MFNDVTKMLTMWDECEPVLSLPAEYRTNRYNSSMVHHEVRIETLSDCQSIFRTIEDRLKGRCVTVQLFFNGDLPESKLQQLGFTKNPSDSRIYKLPHNLQVSALHLEATNSWVLQITKRTGTGIQSYSLNLSSLFESTLTYLELELEAI